MIQTFETLDVNQRQAALEYSSAAYEFVRSAESAHRTLNYVMSRVRQGHVPPVDSRSPIIPSDLRLEAQRMDMARTFAFRLGVESSVLDDLYRSMIKVTVQS